MVGHRLSYLEPFAETVAEHELLDALAATDGNVAQAIVLLGVDERGIKRRVAKLKKKAALKGIAPENDMVHQVAEGFAVKGTSTLYADDGSVKVQWVKTQQSHEDKLSSLNEAIADAMEGFKGIYKPRKAPVSDSEDLMACYVMGDPHIGCYAHAEEAGENFDVDIAREDLINATSRLVDVAPKTDRALIVNLGDFFHADNSSERTTRSGAKLDVDSRWHRVLQAGCMLMVDLISMALSKHPTVEVINCIGNHDDHSSVMLSAFLAAYFHKEPRVLIHSTVNKFNYITHGKVLIGTTHGDTVRTNALSELMATDEPQLWAESEHRYWYTGHIHHTTRQELRGCVQESFRTMAAKDAWHHNSGYRSGRDMYCIVQSKEYGEVERYRCDIRRARSGRLKSS